VEEEPWAESRSRGLAVEQVAREGVAQRGKVGPDLVHAACVQPQLHEADRGVLGASKVLHTLKLGDRPLAMRRNDTSTCSKRACH